MTKKTYHTKSGKEIRLWQGDCMDLMETGQWNLAIVDPPYGIGDFADNGRRESESWENGKSSKEIYGSVTWNESIPDPKYFERLYSVSEHQVIFGFNHYSKHLRDEHRGVIVHDFEDGNFTMSHADIAITDLQKRITMFRYLWAGYKRKGKHNYDWNRIHQCEKPVNLYRWILKNYAKEEWSILDTHGGSMSLAAACYMEDFELDIIELDKDYYNDAVKRFEQHTSQKTLF